MQTYSHNKHLILVVFHLFMCTSYVAIVLLEIVKQKGLEHVTVDDLVAEITPKGRGKFHLFVSQSLCPFLTSLRKTSWSLHCNGALFNDHSNYIS